MELEILGKRTERVKNMDNKQKTNILSKHKLKHCYERRKCEKRAMAPPATHFTKSCLYKKFIYVNRIVSYYTVTTPIRHIAMGECNTILSAYTKYRHLG